MNIQTLIDEMRTVASKTGPMHAWWDIISDLECIRDGKPTFIKQPAEHIICLAKQSLACTESAPSG